MFWTAHLQEYKIFRKLWTKLQNVQYQYASGNKSCCFALISHNQSGSIDPFTSFVELAICRCSSLILMWGNCNFRFLIFSISSSDWRRPKQPQRKIFNVGIDFNQRSVEKSILVFGYVTTLNFSREFKCSMMLSTESLKACLSMAVFWWRHDWPFWVFFCSANIWIL